MSLQLRPFINALLLSLKTIYLERCASCHRSGNEGFQVGPDVVSVKNSGKEKLLISILDPNREVAPQYLAYSVETKDGETLLGIVGSETGASLILLQPNGKSTPLPRSSIKAIESQRQSLMPEGLEIGLSRQQMADLLEFIVNVPFALRLVFAESAALVLASVRLLNVVVELPPIACATVPLKVVVPLL